MNASYDMKAPDLNQTKGSYDQKRKHGSNDATTDR